MEIIDTKYEKEFSYFSDNALLNKVNGLAGISGLISIYKTKPQDKDSKVDIQQSGHLSISDCNRLVTLDIKFDNDREYNNSLYKLKTISEFTNKMIKALKHAKKQYDKLEKENNETR